MFERPENQTSELDTASGCTSPVNWAIGTVCAVHHNISEGCIVMVMDFTRFENGDGGAAIAVATQRNASLFSEE